jgi:Ninjurin
MQLLMANDENDDIDIYNMENDRSVIPISTHKLVLQQKENTFNTYATNKSYSQNLLNASTFQQQIGFIIGMFVGRSSTISPIDIIFISFVGVSIIIECFLFLLMSMLAKATTEQVTKNCTATMINNIVTMLSLISMICNFVTTAIFSAIAIERNNELSSMLNTTR